MIPRRHVLIGEVDSVRGGVFLRRRRFCSLRGERLARQRVGRRWSASPAPPSVRRFRRLRRGRASFPLVVRRRRLLAEDHAIHPVYPATRARPRRRWLPPRGKQSRRRGVFLNRRRRPQRLGRVQPGAEDRLIPLIAHVPEASRRRADADDHVRRLARVGRRKRRAVSHGLHRPRPLRRFLRVAQLVQVHRAPHQVARAPRHRRVRSLVRVDVRPRRGSSRLRGPLNRETHLVRLQAPRRALCHPLPAHNLDAVPLFRVRVLPACRTGRHQMRALALDQVGHVQAPVLGHQRLELGALILCISRDTHAQSEESLGYVADFLHR
mmetsp:Transcript_10297/g.40253  ORF Transcript_10297/g.40253 Transcript_10297/m.40253 type:complete len:323 (-) Transcript_10297:265-1233(-)